MAKEEDLVRPFIRQSLAASYLHGQRLNGTEFSN